MRLARLVPCRLRRGANRSGNGSRRGRHRAPKRRRAPLWAKLVAAVGALLIAVSGGTIAAGKLLLKSYADGFTQGGGLGAATATNSGGGASLTGPLNFLLVGIDERGGGDAQGARADSIIVAHVPATHDAVYLASIPRDTRVRIPAKSTTGYAGGTDKINAAFQFGSQHNGGRDGGLALLAETVSNLTGGALKFNAAAIVNFDGLRDVVKALGGLRMYVDEKVTSVHVGEDITTGQPGVPYHISADGRVGGLRPNMRPQVYDVGWHEFNDWQALDYVRQRDLLAGNDGDYGRQRHQQQFLKAVAEKMTSTGVLTDPVRVNAVLTSVGRAVTFYNNGIDVADWILALKDIRPDKMVLIKTNGGSFHPVRVDGVEYEDLTPASRQMFSAMATDDIARFTATHRSWISG